MSTSLDGFDLVTPASLEEALGLLASDPAARPFAGGTDLMVQLEAGRLRAGRYVNLWDLAELRGITESPESVAVGALTTYTDIRNADVLAREYPLLVRAAEETGGTATQNRGTIGGNIANASPAADTPPALLVYDAELELRSTAGTRRVPYTAFHTAYKQMILAPGEIISRIRLPRRTGWLDYYRKVGPRRAQAISKVCFAGSIAMSGDTVADVRIALGSVAPFVVRAVQAESVLRGKSINDEAIAAAERALRSEVAPIDDLRSTAEYRLRVASNLLREFLSHSQ
ncbi:MAG: carbon monoxide dehydrogenase [Acidobacteria bacterium]|nr:MAG: carbon monoxide dehydrogenase [Acidobacteriota bacterium]